MKPKQEKQLYGLIGYPVKHSFSAIMHNAAFNHLGINAEYQLFEVSPEKLENFFKKTIPEIQIKGFNITVPHKEAAVRYLNGAVAHGVVMNQAVNTVRVEEGLVLCGFNTDGPGFLRDLKEKDVVINNKIVAMIGAGGGAKAVATSVASRTPKEIRIFDIDILKTKRLAEIIKSFYPNVNVKLAESLEDLNILGTDILINATPVGMKEQDPLLVKQEWMHGDLFVYDLIYNPQETKLLKTAKGCGCRYANGLGMLLYQGVLAFEHWFPEREAPVEQMRKALEERIHA